MSIFNFLPEFLIHLLLVVGVLGTIVGFVLGTIPFVNRYKLPIQVISTVILAVAVYFEGKLSNENKWKLHIKELETKVAEAEAKAAKVNTKIVEKIVKQKEYIKVKGDRIVEYIDREVKVFDDRCTIPKTVINAHNMAAESDVEISTKFEEIVKDDRKSSIVKIPGVKDKK